MGNLNMIESHQRQLELFENCFRNILATGVATGEFPEPGQDLRQLATDWAHGNVRMLVCGVDSDDVIRGACAALALSPVFVDAVLSSYDGASDRCAALSPDLKFAQDTLLTRIIHRTARNRPRPPNTWARDFIAKNFIKQPIRIVVNDIKGLALIAHFS